MPRVIHLTNSYHCFTADTRTLNTNNLSTLLHPDSFTLEEFDISKTTFDGMPDRPPDWAENGLLRPFTRIDYQCSTDARSEHSFWLFKLKESGVTRLARLVTDEIEPFSRQWSSDFIFASNPHGAFTRIQKFLHFFCPICRDALARNRDIYVLWERHEYWAL